ncbi:FtsK/SpoIIIE domain-containing protein [Myceligenerans salitolerans]|uniref:FtsK domain-containing protein n=1 Tax=Myceligenerans salitolerans TaxID=1230528 RepID=A0ABS3I8Q3_9MICO|nr:FtsK/SpoIIIE domain-containing protein [Myceligenerans salitolerans]MBO0609375.1 hypothetical protein [Myceligenerans salitolerans]
MTRENEDRTPSDAELAELVYGNNPHVGGGELDQGMVQPEDNPAPDAEVIDAPAPSADVAARPARVIEHRGDREVPVLPEWLTSWDVFVPAFRRHAKFLATWSAHHGVRSPLYTTRFLGRAALGLGICTKALARWVLDSENKAKRAALIAGAKGTTEYKTLRKEHADGVRARLGGLAAGGVLLGVAGATINAQAGPDGLTVATMAAGAAAVTGLGIVGTRRVAAPIAETRREEVPPLTVDTVTDALMTLGLSGQRSEVRKGNAEIKILRIFSTTGGVEIHVDLPPGATVADVIKNKEKLAGALRRPQDCVWPEGNAKAHPSRLNLYIADKALSERDLVRFAYRNKGAVNVFEDFVIGEDQRGRPVSTCLMYNNGVVGGLPGAGKTFLLRVLMLGAALDPRTELHIHEFKGTGDLMPLEPISHVCRSGSDEDDYAALLADLNAITAEMNRRSKIIRDLPISVSAEKKLTDDLAAVGNPHGLRPLLLVIDESQLPFGHKVIGKEIVEKVENILRLGRALGIMVWLATQRPSAEAIPARISALLSLRICLRVGDQVTNDMVLGTSAYQAGRRATVFSQEDKGTALMLGEKADTQLLRSAYVDGILTEQVVARARAEREAKGLLSGVAAGEEPGDDDYATVLDHLIAVWPENDPEWPNGKVWADDLAERLAGHIPALYEGWDGSQVLAAAKRHGVTYVQVKHHGQNKRGLARTDITRELTPTTDEED